MMKNTSMIVDGEEVLVPIDCMSNEQLLVCAEQQFRMAEGYKAHAEELRRYVELRTAETAGK